jgi:hypothetical protein
MIAAIPHACAIEPSLIEDFARDGDRRRRVFSARYLGDDIRHAPRRWKTSPDFPGLAGRLPAAEPLDDPQLPVVWPRP